MSTSAGVSPPPPQLALAGLAPAEGAKQARSASAAIATNPAFDFE
jgi:hypothetical protein